MRDILISLVLITLLMTEGCQKQELSFSGRSSILNNEWKSQVETGKTTENELILLLGQPTAYYHRSPQCGQKYLFYSSTVTVHTRTHYPLLPKAQLASNNVPYSFKIWFLISNGLVAQQMLSGEEPDLKEFILSDGPEYPFSDKCSLKGNDKL